MVIYNIQNFTNAFANGLEALFGSMLARGEKKKLQITFAMYDTMLSTISVVLFSVTAVMIVPFIKLYTSKLTDANYIMPFFSFMLTLASMTYCIRIPYHEITIAAGHFRQTKAAAYGEAIINIVTSCLLVIKYGLNGVGLGTLLATVFRFVFYAWYVSKHILERKISVVIRREVITYALFFGNYYMGNKVISCMVITNYFQWGISAVVITLFTGIVSMIVTCVFYKAESIQICKRIFRRG